MCPRVLCQSYLDRSRPRIREPLLTFVLVLKPEGFMTASSLLDSRCDPLPSPILITDSGGAHRFYKTSRHPRPKMSQILSIYCILYCEPSPNPLNTKSILY